MPCYGGPLNYQNPIDRYPEIENKLKKVEAILCAVLTTLENSGEFRDVVSSIDFEEAGVTEKQFRIWWRKHKRANDRRRSREHARKLEEQIEQKKQEAKERKLYVELHKKYGNGNTLQGVASLIEGNVRRRETPKERAFKQIERHFERLFSEFDEDYELWNYLNRLNSRHLNFLISKIETEFGVGKRPNRGLVRQFFLNNDKQGLLEYVYELQQL